MHDLIVANSNSSDPIQEIHFDSKTKSAIIDLPTLERTIKLEDAGGKLPRTCPIEHSNLLMELFYMAQDYTGKKVTVKPLTIREGNVRRIRRTGADKNSPCPVESYVVERLVGKIQIDSFMFPDIDNAHGAMSIAVSYTEKGIQIAFGHNVFACDNLNIFGEHMFSTYGGNHNKMDYSKGMQLLEKWLKEHEEVAAFNRKHIEDLMNVYVDERVRVNLIGTLFERAVRFNNRDRSVIAPLNQTECAGLVAAGFDQIIDKDSMITGWDMTNWATSVLKPDRSDMVSLLDSNYLINQFMYDELCG